MNHEQEVRQTVVEKLNALGVVRADDPLLQQARDRQLVDVRCEMPLCYCDSGRRYFEPRSPGVLWMPTADHYPKLQMYGGRLTRDNVRLAHRCCNQRDHWLRKRIGERLLQRKSLQKIAEELNAKNVPTVPGVSRWTAARVRKAFVS